MPKKKKQFDFSDKKIDESLQDAQLASFPSRALAYILDLAIYHLATVFLWLLVPLGLLLLFGKKKARKKAKAISARVAQNMEYLEQHLETYSIAEPLRKQFVSSLRIYIKLAIYIPAVIFTLVGVLVLWGVVEPFGYLQFRQSISGELEHFRSLLDLTNATYFIVKFLGVLVYFSFFTWRWKGQTPGKRIMKIQTVKLNGKKITLWNAIERASGYATSTAFLLLGFFQYFWDKNHQTTHDKITETVVIKTNTLTKPTE